MFTIKSTQTVNWSWASFALVKGENVFPSRQSVPKELWPKLERFRELKILDFEGEAEAGDDKVVLAELTEQQLFQMSKADLAELAKASGIVVAAPEGMTEPSKKLLLDALVPLGKPAPKLDAEPATEAAPEDAKAEAPAQAGKRGGGKSVSASTTIKDE